MSSSKGPGKNIRYTRGKINYCAVLITPFMGQQGHSSLVQAPIETANISYPIPNTILVGNLRPTELRLKAEILVILDLLDSGRSLSHAFLAAEARLAAAVGSTQLPSKNCAADLFRFFRQLRSLVLAVGGSALFLFFAPKIYRNYVNFLYLSKNSGLPGNVFGWLFASALTGLGREVFSTKQYDRDSDKSTWVPGGPVPRRKGERPTIGWQCVPHRQITQRPTDEMAKAMVNAFAQYARERTDLVEVVPSMREGGSVDSYVIHKSLPSPPAPHVREIAHVHTNTDYSVHVVLSSQDCKAVIEAGWGERHPLSGVVKLPKEYLLIYAPRDEEELKTVMRILRGSVGFLTGSKDV